MKRRAAFVILSLLVGGGCRGHASVTVAPAEGVPAVSLSATYQGKGCALVKATPEGDVYLLAEQDGASVNIASILRTMLGSVGEVFGASRDEQDALQQGEGCAGAFDPPAPAPLVFPPPPG